MRGQRRKERESRRSHGGAPSFSMRSSHDSATLTPASPHGHGPVHQSYAGPPPAGPGRTRRSETRRSRKEQEGSQGGGFFASLFGRSKSRHHGHHGHQQQQQPPISPRGSYAHPGTPPQGTPTVHGGADASDYGGPDPSQSAEVSTMAKFKALLSFAPQRHQHSRDATPTRPPAGPGGASRDMSPAGGAALDLGSGPAGSVSEFTVKDLQHRMQLLQVQVQDYERIKAQLAVETRSAGEWKEKWNYQNFKLNLMVDMLVVRVLELDGEEAGAAGGAAAAVPQRR